MLTLLSAAAAGPAAGAARKNSCSLMRLDDDDDSSSYVRARLGGLSDANDEKEAECRRDKDSSGPGRL